MTPLAALLDAIRTDSTLAWLLVHAPDGDADAAVRRAWEGAGPVDLFVLGDRLDRAAEVITAWNDCVYAAVRGIARPDIPSINARGCAAVRAAVPCPSWAELTRAA